MKTIYFILLSSLTLIFISGCQDLTENPKATLTPESYFRTQADLDGAVTGVYTKFTGDHTSGSVTFFSNAFSADDLSTHSASNKGDMRDYDRLVATAGNWRTGSNWQLTWTAINQANFVIANYQKVESTDDLKNGSAAQAYFLRAFGYFRLVKEFGEIPLVLKPTDVEVRLPRSSVKEVYDAIVTDLKTAISLFPQSFPIKSNRANPLAAKALLAEVYLNMAGWPLNLTDHYALAAASANEVIQSGKFSLVPDYLTCFTTNDNEESIFAFKFNLGGGFGATISRMWGQFAIPEQEVAMDGSSGWNDFCTEKSFYRNAPKCKRSWQTFYDTLKIRIVEKVNGKDKITFKKIPWDAPEATLKQVYFKKFRYGLGVPGNGDGCTETSDSLITMSPSSGKDAVLIRYAGVLLTYAEASAMAEGAPSGSAYDAINLVRHRAGLEDLTPGLAAIAFRDSVVHERAYEFAGEYGVRWHDIQRLQLLPQVVAQRASDEPNKIPEGIDLSTKYLAPIPQDEMFTNPTWEQNPGY